MSHNNLSTRVTIALMTGISLAGIATLLFVSLRQQCNDTDFSSINASMIPWASIGGCGAGGSGGGGGGGAKWVGRGVSGGLLDIQLMMSDAIGQNFEFKTFSSRFSMKPTYTSTLGLSLPIVAKSGVLQPMSNIPASTENTGGLGDISVDYSTNIGLEGEYSVSLALSLPTGQSDIKRGTDNESKVLPSSLQKGSGMYSATMGLSYSKDFDDAMLLFDASYSHPFMLSFSGKNQFFPKPAFELDSCSAADRSRFEYWFKPYGENDLGGFTPPSVSASVFYGYKGEELYTYSFGATFSAPLGVAWNPSYRPGAYDPRPDPDFKCWTASLNYGMEFTSSKYPIFIGVSLPFHDKTNPPDANITSQQYDPSVVYKWDGPDFKSMLQAWSFSIGMKATLF